MKQRTLVPHLVENLAASETLDGQSWRVMEEPEELMYETNHEANLSIMREISKIRFWEHMRQLTPMIARELTAAGVDFSKAKIPTETQVETIIKDAMRGEIW